MDRKPISGTRGKQSVRQAVDLQSGVSQRVAAYVVAAGAAGVGLLALAPAARASIIYTPSNVTYTTGSGSLGIDLENNGTINFNLGSGSRSGLFRTLRFNGNSIKSNSVRGYKTHTLGVGFASALTKGAAIGPGQVFQNANATTSHWGNFGLQMVGETFGRSFLSGPWANVSDRYLGLKFEVNGQTYYGWVGFSFVGAQSSQFGLTATLSGYAYDTVPNQQVLAGQTTTTPEPATLGLLALGSLGLGFWRRRRTTANSQ